MARLNTTARFLDKKVHLFREMSDDRAVTYCGLGERAEIWRDLDANVTCGFCIRRLAERVNEIGAKVDAFRSGAGGALYG